MKSGTPSKNTSKTIPPEGPNNPTAPNTEAVSSPFDELLNNLIITLEIKHNAEIADITQQ